MKFRIARKKDASLIAKLHAESWQNAYRGILSDNYLDNNVFDERLSKWTERLTNMPKNRHIILAFEKDEPIGFICVFGNDDPNWGALIDNLHIHPDKKGRGIGKVLMQKAAIWVKQNYPDSGLYLWVYEANHAAVAFYEKMQGKMVEKAEHESTDGTSTTVLRYVWGDLNILL